MFHLITGLWILHRYRESSVFYGFYFFMQTWALVSCWYNDLGIYNPELFRYTDTSLATTRLALFYLLFNIGFVMVAQWCRMYPLARNDYEIKWGRPDSGYLKALLIGAIGVLYVYVVYEFYRNGIPILQGIDRLLFVTEGGAVEKSLVVYGPFLAFLLGYFRPDHKRWSAQSVMMASFVVYKILTANKFSGLMAIVVPYYLPIVVRLYLQDRNFTLLRRRYLAAVSGVVALLLGFAFVTYVSLIGSGDGAYQFLTDRVLANQGQLWWAVDNEKFAPNGSLPHLGELELGAILSPESINSEETGMKALMIHLLGPEIAYPIIDKGYLYTMAYPAILITSVPYGFSALIQIVAGGLLAMCLYYLFYCISYRHLVRALVALTILLPLLAVLATGSFTVFMTLGMVVKVTILIIAEGGLVRTQPAGASV
jgi:hypothetical protein